MLVVGAVFALALLQEPKVTLTVQATSAANALRLLGAAVHKELLTSAQTGDDILTFRFADVPFSEAMRRIADVDDAEWKSEKGALRLVRPPKLQQSELDWEMSRKAEEYSRAISHKAAELQKPAPWSDQEADRLAGQVEDLIKAVPASNPPPEWRKRAQVLVDQAPISRAIKEVVLSMEPVELAGLSPTLRTVWSTRPTRTQRPFAPKIATIIEQYVQDEAGWMRAVDAHSLTAPELGANPYWSRQLANLLGDQNRRIATVLLTTEPQDEFSLTAYDERGKLIAQATDSLERSHPTDPASMKALFPNPEEKPLSLEGDDRMLYDFVHQPGEPMPPPPPALFGRLTNPDHFDPLHLSGSPMILRVAESRNVNMVARLTDGMFEFDNVVSGQQNDAAKAFSNLSYADSLLDFKDGWITIRPSRPASSRETQADRQALGKYMRRRAMDKPLSIDEQATLVASLPQVRANRLPMRLGNLLHNPETVIFDDNFLRFYAEASAPQKEWMMADGLALSSLTAPERVIVNELVYGQHANPLTFSPNSGSDGSPIGDPDLYTTGLFSEPTEALPNGLPPDGFVRMRIDSTTSVYFPSDEGKAHGPGISVGALVMWKYFQDHPELGRPIKLDLSHFLVGKQTRITFTFQFTPLLSMTGSLQDGNTTDLKPASFAELPSDFKAEFEKDYKDWASRMAMRSAGTGGTSAPPP